MLSHGTRQLVYATLFFVSMAATAVYIRLGVVGMMVAAYIFFDVRYGVTKKIPGFWRKRRYWQKGAILFGIIHVILFIATLDTFKGEGGIGLVFLEFPLFLMSNFIHDVAGLTIQIPPSSIFGPSVLYYSLILWGTLAYAFFGAVLGLLVDFGKYLFKAHKRGRTQ